MVVREGINVIVNDANQALPTNGAKLVDPRSIDTLLVPVDRSHDSWRALDLACGLGTILRAKVAVVEVVAFDDIVAPIAEMLASECAERPSVVSARTRGLEVETTVVCGADPADSVRGLLHEPYSLAVMASHGRGRTAALVGSVASGLIAVGSRAVLCVGPSVTDAHLAGKRWSGPVVVTVDGSELSERALPEAARWADHFGVLPWIVEVHEPNSRSMVDVLETAYPARLAESLGHGQRSTVQYEALHGDHVAETVGQFAGDSDASLIVAATQGRTGLERLVLGSTAAGFVRHAPCPVLLVNPRASSY